MQLFGFEIKRKTDEADGEGVKSFVEKDFNDGALYISAAPMGGGVSSFINLDANISNEADIVQKYRGMMNQPEVENAVDDIVNEMVSIEPDTKSVKCITDDIQFSDQVKKKIEEEFDEILNLLHFSSFGYDIVSRWYVDGRINYHVVIDENNPKQGIKELRYIDPRKLRLVKEYEQTKINAADFAESKKRLKNEYYVYSDKGFNMFDKRENKNSYVQSGLRISKDSIINSNSGILSEDNSLILSHLHKAFKPLNQLKRLEDATVIYRLSRAPERRAIYVDVGNLPKSKAEEYMRNMMVQHKNRLVYNAETGEVQDDRRSMTMTDDFWLPRREGGKGTEITTLSGAQNLGEIEDILYFQRKLFKALKVPISRMEPENGFSLGRASEITRDEVKFSKFIKRLRSRFSVLFLRALEKQLILKGIVTPEDWKTIENNIRFDFMKDNHFEELKQSEVLRERINILRDVDEYVGVHYSKEWVKKNILKMSDTEIDTEQKQMEKEKAEEPEEPEESF